MKQKRITSKVVWVAALAQVLLLVGVFMPNVADEVKLVGGVIIEMLTLFGILNNPTDAEQF